MNDDSATDPALLAFQVFNEIGIINQLTSAEFQRALGAELGQSEFMVLNRCVRVGDGVTPSRLARIFQITRPSMTAILAKLEAKGFVDVTPSEEDRRQKIVKITPAGRRAREKGVAAIAPVIQETIEDFGFERLKALLPGLVALREYADARRNERDGLD